MKKVCALSKNDEILWEYGYIACLEHYAVVSGNWQQWWSMSNQKKNHKLKRKITSNYANCMSFFYDKAGKVWAYVIVEKLLIRNTMWTFWYNKIWTQKIEFPCNVLVTVCDHH